MPQEWLKYRQDKENTGHSKGTASMTHAPKLEWSYDIAGWSGYCAARIAPGYRISKILPYHTIVAADYYENNKYEWGLGSPRYDLYGTGKPVPLPESPAVKVAHILKDRPGMQRVIMDSYYRVGDNARARLYAYNGGVEQLVWTSEAFPTCYGPVVCIADANNDGQLDVIISMHYRLVVLNGATGATMMNFKYYEQRNYGFLGVANIDNDPYPEFCVISDFAQHIEVIDNNGSNLALKWFTQIEASIVRNTCVTRPGPNALIDADNDGQIEVVCNIFNYNNNHHWSILLFNALDGAVKYQLDNSYLNGSADIDHDGLSELFVTVTYGREVPTYGELRIYKVVPGTGKVQLWSYQKARFNTRMLETLPLTVNTMATNGQSTIVHGQVGSNLRDDFLVSEPGANQTGENCKCFGFDADNQVYNRFTINGPKASKLEALAVKNQEVLFSINTRGDPNEILSSSDGQIELKQWTRKTPLSAGPPVVADLEGNGKLEIIMSTSDGAIICFDAPRRNQDRTPKIRWRMRGQGMTKDASTKQDGVLVADLDHDGRKEVIFARETVDGKAGIVAVRPDGSLKWQHIFPGFSGSTPVWNVGGITYWLAGNFTAKNRLDLYVTIRSSKMHSDAGFLLNGRNGGIIWEQEGVLLPGGDPIRDIRGHGGDRIACADLNNDGLDELVWAYPDRVSVIDGRSGNPIVIKSTSDSLFSGCVTYYAVPVVVNLTGKTTPEIFYGRCGYLTALLDNTCNVIWKRDYSATGNNGCNYLQGIGDVDHDGKLEIGGAYQNSVTGAFEFRFYRGDSGADYITHPLQGNFGAPCTDVVTADLDHDGCDEFLFGQGSSLQCMGQYGLKWTLDIKAIPGEIALADSDRDGVLEIIVTTADGYLKIYR
jgi:hypothetical protein